MKKIKFFIIISIIIIITISISLFIITKFNTNEEEKVKDYQGEIGDIEVNLSKNKNKKIIEYKDNVDLSLIKKAIKEKEYYQFEDNEKNYIFFIIQEKVYAPNEVKINDITVADFKYENDNKLNILLDIDKTVEEKETPQGWAIDGFKTDKKEICLEIDKKISEIMVNGEKYTQFTGGRIIDLTNPNQKKYGYINEIGKIVIPLEYDYVDEIQDNQFDYSNYVDVYKDGYHGIFDKQGNKHLECKYIKIIPFENNIFIVEKYDENNIIKTGVVDIDENIIFDFDDSSIDDIKIKLENLKNEQS